MGCFLKYIYLGLDSSMKDQVGILGVSHFCTWHETIRSQRNIHPSNHLALFSSPIANTQYTVLEGSLMKRSHVTQSVHMMTSDFHFLGLHNVYHPQITHCFWTGSRRHAWPWTLRFPVKVSVTGLYLTLARALVAALAYVLVYRKGRDRHNGLEQR